MDRTTISRGDLRKNFLKKIIMRLDFQGVLQAEMESVLLLVKPYLKEKEFTRYEEKVTNQIVNTENTIADVKSQIVYSFVSEAFGYTIELSCTSIILTVRSQRYSSFDNYSEIFCHIVEIYRDKIDFFTVKRFGLRKINLCFVKNRDDINKYFVPSYYCCDTPLDDYKALLMERTEKLSDTVSNINLKYSITEGKVGTDLYYQVALDSDIYLTNQSEIENAIYNKEEMSRINDKLFSIYLSALTDDFLQYLISSDENTIENVLGVELNE